MQYQMWQRAINNAVTCLISLLDCLAPFTAAYPACVRARACGLNSLMSKPEGNK